MRINKFIASCGVASRRKAEQFISEGLVKVNNKIITNLAFDVDETKDVVTLNDQKISLANEYVYYMLNKPKGYVTTMSDEKNRKSIIDLIGNIDNRVYPVGRLDYESEGLLIFTNDGELIQRMQKPEYKVEKEYLVTVDRMLSEIELKEFANGLETSKGNFLPCKIYKTGNRNYNVIIKEGKKRQIRNMFAYFGSTVKRLERVRIGPILIGSLKEGEHIKLTSKEVRELYKCTGLK